MIVLSIHFGLAVEPIRKKIEVQRSSKVEVSWLDDLLPKKRMVLIRADPGSSANSRDHRQPLSTATWERSAVECGEMGGFGYDTLENSDGIVSPKKGGHFKRKVVFQVLFITGHVSFGGSNRWSVDICQHDILVPQAALYSLKCRLA